MISTGYYPYAHYVRDYNPPAVVPGGQESPYSTSTHHTLPTNKSGRQSSLLNVTDPRYSATYGNPLLRQVFFTTHELYDFPLKFSSAFFSIVSRWLLAQGACSNIQPLCLDRCLLPKCLRRRSIVPFLVSNPTTRSRGWAVPTRSTRRLWGPVSEVVVGSLPPQWACQCHLETK